MPNGSRSKLKSSSLTPAMIAIGSVAPVLSSQAVAPFGNLMTAWPEYMVDALQRSVLFLDLMRQRGNEEIEITSRPLATVLRFDHEVLMDGGSLPRPINYSLAHRAAGRGRDRSAQTAGRGGRPPSWSGGPRISAADSRVSVRVIPANEELMIAQHTHALLFPQMEASASRRKSGHDRH
jgi:hypothetical protein